MKLLCCGTARTKSRHRLRAKHTTRENGSCLRARAVKDYSKSKDRTHLSFREGDIIIVTEQNSNGLWKGVRYGSYKGRPGYFPASAVVLAESESTDQNSERQQGVLTSQSTVDAYRSLAVRLSTAAAADGVVGSGISPGGGSQCSGASAYQLSCQACSGALTLTEHRLSGQSCESGVSTSSSRHSCHSARSGGGIIGGGVVPSGSGSMVTGTGSATDPSSSNGSSSSSSRGSINRLEESGYSSTVNVHELMMQGLTDSEVLQSWLNGLHLEEYYCLFAEAAYDMPTISRMTPEDLTAIGVAKPSVRKVLKTEIGRLTIRDGIPDYKPETIDEWLESLHLSQYTETLQRQGYTDINKITEITWEDLEEIGINKLGHQKKMMLAIDRLRRMDAGQRRLSGAQTSTSSSSTSTKSSSGLSSAVVVSACHDSTVSSSAAARSTTAVVHPPSLSTMSARTVHYQPLPPVAEASPLIPRQVASVGNASLSARTCYLSSVSQPLQQPLIAVTSSSSVVPVEFNKFHQQLQQHNYQQPKSLQQQQQQQQRCVNTAAPLNSSSISAVSLAKSSALSSAMTSSTPPATVTTSLQCHRSQPQLQQPRDIECVAAPSQFDRFPSASMVPQTLIGKDDLAEAACLEQAAGQSSDQLTSGVQRSMITTTMVSSKAPQQQQLLSFSSTPTLNTTSSCSLSSHVTPLTRLSTTSALKQTTNRPPVQYVVGPSNNFKVIVGSDWLPADNLDGNGGVQASSTPKRLGVEPTLSCFRPPSVNDDNAKVSCGTLPRSKPSQMQCIAVGSQSNIRGQQTLVPAIKSTSPSLSYLDRCQSFPVAPASIETAYRKEPPVPPVRTHSFKADVGPTRYTSKGVDSDGGGFVGGRIEGVSSADGTKIRDSESQLFVFHDTGPVLQLSLPQNSSRATPSKLNQRYLGSCSSSGDLLNDVIEQLERRDVAVCSAPISAATTTVPRTAVAVSTFNSGPLQTAKQSQQRLGDWQDSQPTSSSDSGSEDSDSGLESRLTESTSSLPIAIDTNTLPFANENVGTIKQRGQSTSSSASIKSSTSTSTAASSCSTSPLATTPGVQLTSASSSNNDWPTTAACTAGHDGKPRSFLTVESEAVFNDIDGMLMGLTAELDEMLKTAVLN